MRSPIPLTLILLACTRNTDDTGGAGAVDTRTPGEDQTISVFDEAYVQFGETNTRTIDVEVDLPDASQTFGNVTGRFALSCPNGACDWWDRYGTFGLVIDPGTESETYVELDRFITAYRVGFTWESDLTDLRPLLTSTQTMRVFIDTWVGEGHANGDGWLFTADLDFEGGPPPEHEASAVVPVWGHLAWNAGLDDAPVETQVAPQTVTVPSADGYTLRSFITGHGWANVQNCAEFCAKEHFYTVGGAEFGREVWRDDCEDTETDGSQQGTWKYDRAGWCPGAQVFPWDTDVTASVSGADVDVSYRLEDFTWAGDGDQPYYYMSGLLIAHR